MATGQLIDASGRPLISEAQQRKRASLRSAYEAASNSAAIEKHFAGASAMSARDVNDPATREILRSRSRAECHQNNSFAVGIVRTLVNDILGRGPRLQVTDSRLTAAQKEAVERRYRGWEKASRLTRVLRTGLGSEIVDGEGFLHEATNQRQRDECKLAIKETEADQITTSIVRHDDDRNIDGVHIDDWGYPIKYERLKFHPYDSYAHYSAGTKGFKKDTEEIDAESMIHLFRCERPGQYRGVPWMVSALPLFALLRRYTLAVVMCAESAARHHGVIYSDHPTIDGVDPIDAMDAIELELGQFTTMPEGWKIGQLKAEQPTTVYEMFRNAILTEIARCVSMPKNKALNDSGGYNYASGMLDFQTYYEMIQVERNRIETEAMDRIFGWWFDEAVLIRGYLPDLGSLPGGIDHVWTWDQFRHVDPTKEANATKTLWELGLMTDEEYFAKCNIDPEEHYQRLARQYKRRSEIGAPLPGGPAVAALPEEDDEKSEADETEEAAT